MAHSDFYRFEERMTDEERMIMNMLREFLRQEHVQETVRQCNLTAIPVPHELMRKIATLGIFGAFIPDENGDKVSNLAYGLMMREIEAVDSALRSFASVQSGLVMYPIWKFGSEEQKQRWLPPLRSGEVIGCFGLTEGFGGSNSAAMLTRAELGIDEYILNGSKVLITNAYSADVAVVWGKEPSGEIRGFLVERGARGFEAQMLHYKGSLRASETGSLYFSDCSIPKENVFPHAHGMKSVYSCLNKARYGIAWGAGGIVRTCYEKILEIAMARAPFGTPLSGKQLVQQDLAVIDANLVKITALCFQLANLADMCERGEIKEKEFGDQVSFAKWQCVEMAKEAVDKALELAGGPGIGYDLPFWAHWANIPTLRTYEGTAKIHTLIQGRRITGISAF